LTNQPGLLRADSILRCTSPSTAFDWPVWSEADDRSGSDAALAVHPNDAGFARVRRRGQRDYRSHRGRRSRHHGRHSARVRGHHAGARAQSARRVLHAGQHRRASRTSQLSGRGSKRQRSGREDLRPSTTWIANASRISSTVPDTPAEGLTADFRTRHTARAAPCRSAGAWSRRCRKWCADRRLCGGAPRRSPPAWHRGIRRRPARCARARW